jgi:hypothetical protein
VASLIFLGVVLAALIVEFKGQRNKAKFWILLMILSGVHLLAWQLAGRFGLDIKPIWMGIITPVEVAFFVNVVDFAIKKR